MRSIHGFAVALSTILLANCGVQPGAGAVRDGAEGVRKTHQADAKGARIAPDAPGAVPTWSNAQKVGIGTSFEAYDANGQYSDDGPTGVTSKVWFSLGKDRITEVMWGLIHEAQIREIRFVVVGPEGIIEPTGFGSGPLLDADERPMAPATALGLRGPDGSYRLLVAVLTDPDRQTLVSKVQLISERDGLKVFALIDPAMGNTGSGDRAELNEGVLTAREGDFHLAAIWSSEKPLRQMVGYVGVSDGINDLSDGVLDDFYASANVPGNVALVSEVPLSDNGVATLYIGFGNSADKALAEAEGSRVVGVQALLTQYWQGWADYLDTLEYLPTLAEASSDGGKLAYMSAINLKVMEDKTHAGALIASLSNPWGDTALAETPQTGYKAVWPRDFFQVASAFLAMGDEATALAAYRYLPRLQVSDTTPGNSGVTGWFLQKTHVDGELEWVAVQQDQTAMPIMLGWKLWQAGVISDDEMAASYAGMVKPAADFLVDGGKVGLLWNTEFEARLGYTQHERWEEQAGYSPSTIAAVISGLVTAGDLAQHFGEPADAARYLAAADALEAQVEALTFTTQGALGDGAYYLRINRNEDPNDKGLLSESNGRAAMAEDMIVDGGFLELVRYGVRAADDPHILGALAELDEAREDNLRLRYELEGELAGWRRYGNDGYGEDGAGTGFQEPETGNTPGQRGRVWPFFTGERGHYELAVREQLLAELMPQHPDVIVQNIMIDRAVTAMEAFANEGLQLPEQIWDGVGDNPFGYELGEGTNSATPLAWTHAEYIKLLRSVSDGAVWDRYSVVEQRYAAKAKAE